MTSQELQHVEEMVLEGLSAMELVLDTTPVEILLAAYTLTLRATQTALRDHPEYRELCQQAAQVLMLECVTPRPN